MRIGRIFEEESAPPLPPQSGFQVGVAYRVERGSLLFS